MLACVPAPSAPPLRDALIGATPSNVKAPVFKASDQAPPFAPAHLETKNPSYLPSSLLSFLPHIVPLPCPPNPPIHAPTQSRTRRSPIATGTRASSLRACRRPSSHPCRRRSSARRWRRGRGRRCRRRLRSWIGAGLCRTWSNSRRICGCTACRCRRRTRLLRRSARTAWRLVSALLVPVDREVPGRTDACGACLASHHACPSLWPSGLNLLWTVR